MVKKNSCHFLLTSLPDGCNYLYVKAYHLVSTAYQTAYHTLTIPDTYQTFFCCIVLIVLLL